MAKPDRAVNGGACCGAPGLAMSASTGGDTISFSQSPEYAAIEQAVYEAAIVPERWADALGELAATGEGFGTVLFSVSDWGSQWTASPPIMRIMQRFVEDGWAARNSRMGNGLRKGLHLMPRFVTEADHFEPGEVEHDALTRDFFRPNGLGHSAGTITHLPHGDMLCFSVERRYDDGPVPAAALARLDGLRPHLVRAAMLAARLGLERARTAVDTLAQLGFAASALDRDGRVLIANSAFEAAGAQWTTRAGERLALLDTRADTMLRDALVSIEAPAGVRSIPLRNAAAPVRQVLHVLPVRRAAHDIFAKAGAIVVVTSAVDRAGTPALLQVLFDLTAAEAALAQEIGQGRSLADIAARNGRTINTLRNQLKSVLEKTGCRRQAELTLLLARLAPPGL